MWDDVVGQESVVATFDAAARAARSAVESTTGPEGADRADEGDDSAMTHAWLVTGPPGSGRSVAARAFAARSEERRVGNECRL